MRHVLLLSCIGCYDPLTGAQLAARFESIARMRASLEFPCDPTKVHVENLGGDAFRAEGCGFHATYECYADYNSGDTKQDWRYRCDRAVRDDPTPDRD